MANYAMKYCNVIINLKEKLAVQRNVINLDVVNRKHKMEKQIFSEFECRSNCETVRVSIL